MRKVSTRLPMIILAFLCLGNYTAFATEPVFNLNGASICKDATVEVDITLEDFTDMISFQFTVGWDVTVLQINEVSYVNPAVANDIFFGVFTTESEVLTTSWFDNALQGITVDDDEVLFTISFNGIGANSSATMLTFLDDPTIREVSAMEGGNIEVIDGTWNEDLLMVAQPELAEFEVADDVNMGGNGEVDITITNGTAPFSYAWESGQVTEDLANVSVGDYSCTVTDAKNCETVVGPFTVGNIVGVDEIDGLIGVQLFPNPTDGPFHLRVALEYAQAMEISIYNILGNKVYFKQIESANIDLDLNLSDFANGNYIVQLNTKDGSHIQKMQIQK